MSKISDIRSIQVRNRLRGLQNKDGNDVTQKTINTIRKTLSVEDAGVVSNILHSSPIFSRLGVPEEFPKKPANYERNYSLDDIDLRKEIAWLRSRQISNSQKILSFLNAFKKINQNISDEKYYVAMDLIEEVISDYGYSIRVLLKVSYIYTRKSLTDDLRARCKEFLDFCGMSSGNFIARGVVDVLSANYDFHFIRRNIVRREKLEGSSAFRRNIGEWLFFPIKSSPAELSSLIQSQRLASLIDGTFTLFENTINIDYGRRLKLELADFIPSLEIENAWHELASTSFPISHGAEADEDCAFRFYRETIAWPEVERIAKYRARVDALYRESDSRRNNTDPYADELNRSYYSGLHSLSQLACPTDNSAIIEEHFSVEKEGIFGRTLAFVYLISLPLSSKKLDTSQLLTIMNSTSEISNLLHTSHFDLLLEYGETDALFRVIILTLKSQHSKSPRAASRLRSAFETLVVDKYSSDLLAFFNEMARIAPFVASYLFELCDERFLDLLYKLVPEGQSVLQVRASLLLWYAETFDERAYADRARVMQINDRIQRVRGAIDDTRIYVDKHRFQYWIEDNYLDELTAIAREERPSDATLMEGGFGAPEDNYTPQIRMANLLELSFREFCKNTHFGIASYLGRRIRHGTLAGILNSKVEEVISAAKEKEFKHDSQACQFLDEWLRKYKAHVEELGTENLQVYSPKNKPRGLINTNIWSSQKLLIARGTLRSLFEILNRGSIPEVITGLIHSCWQLVQVDLERIRRHFAKCRIVWGMLETSELIKHTRSNHDVVATFCARLNVTTDEVFKTVTGWFHQPQDMVPSAPLTLLFDAVVKEVQEAFPAFTPVLSVLGQSDITLTGGTYHIVYDALYILIGNAAKHGTHPIKITRGFHFVDGENDQRELLVAVKTSCTVEELSRIKMKMEEALTADTSEANAFESGSGFKKLVHLRDYSRELIRMNYSIEDGVFSVDLYFELLA